MIPSTRTYYSPILACAGVAISLVLSQLVLIAGEVNNQRLTPEQVDAALSETAGGFSTDEVLLRDELREAFLHQLKAQTGLPQSTEEPEILEREILGCMLRFRKAGKLTYHASKRGDAIKDEIAPVAEIAARVVTDRHRVSTDDMLMSPHLRVELQQEAEVLWPGVDAYSIRKAILGLRKKRALKPELVLQVAQWDRKVLTYSLAELRMRLANDTIPEQPGAYLFRTPKGYLYIGEAINLAKRLQQHASESDRKTLADYLTSAESEEVSVELHVFGKHSPISKTKVRRAYESELIRSRSPKLNVRP